MTALTVPEVLRRAEQEIGTRGWCQHTLKDEHGAVCARGAIYLAVAATTDPLAMAWTDYMLTEAADDALSVYLGEHVTLWNDREGRTVDEVRAALSAAAEKTEVAA